MAQTIYVVDHALSDGIETIKDAEVFSEGTDAEFAVGKRETPGRDLDENWNKGEFFLNPQDAFDAANAKKLEHIDSMKASIAKWEGFTFDTDHWKYEA